MAEQIRRPVWKSLILAIAGVVIGIVILAVGFEAGRYVGYHWMTKPEYRLDWAVSVIGKEQFSRRNNGRSESARVHLESYIFQLEAFDPTTHKWLRKRDFDLEMGLAYGRLALLAEQEEKADMAKTHWAKAEERMTKSQWRDPSRANLRRVLAHLDRDRSVPRTQSPEKSSR